MFLAQNANEMKNTMIEDEDGVGGRGGGGGVVEEERRISGCTTLGMRRRRGGALHILSFFIKYYLVLRSNSVRESEEIASRLSGTLTLKYIMF